MTLVSSKEFVDNGDKYFDMALEEQVIIKRGDNVFLINNMDGMNKYHDASVYEEILEPDDDLHRAISADEFKKRCLKVIDKIFDK